MGAETFVGIGQRLLTTDQGDLPLMDLRLLRMDGFDPSVLATEETGDAEADG